MKVTRVIFILKQRYLRASFLFYTFFAVCSLQSARHNVELHFKIVAYEHELNKSCPVCTRKKSDEKIQIPSYVNVIKRIPY